MDFLKLRILDSSYTKFANKIGLSLHSDLLKNALLKGQAKVALNFPYKDCVLKGAQSKDSDKSDEIFFNEILASDEIDILFKPKALQNFKLVNSACSDFLGSASDASLRRTASAPHSLTSHNPKNSSTILEFTKSKVDNDNTHNLKSALQHKPNLLIKGNNLLALHTLKSRKDIYGQVKLIYIDPPYNTGSDSFNYNDRFNHSAWLVFMKNRLEIAREFLREDGVIFIQCDDNEQAYLKVLCDEIFGRENFVGCITCKVKSAGGLTTDTEMFFDCAEYILVYAKNMENLTYNTIKLKTEVVNSISKTAKQYNNTINNIQYDKKEFVVQKDNIRYYKIPNGYFNIETLPIKQMKEKDFYDKRNEIFRLTALSGGIGKKLKRHIEDFTNNEDLFIFEYTPTKGKDKGRLTQYLMYKSQTITMLNKLIEVDDKKQIIEKLEPVSNIFVDDFWQGISQEGQIKFKNAKKPEALLKRIIEISTKEGDLVMDFFAGSGTTCAVAHKMNRRWIGIEQMDYVEGITKERLIKVINGEQGGISKAVGWGNSSLTRPSRELEKSSIDRPQVLSQSDFSAQPTNLAQDTRIAESNNKSESVKNEFIYAELMPLNALYKEKIAKSNSESELAQIYDELQTKAFIDYRVDIQEMLKDRDFEALPLTDKKKILYAILDSNMDYVAYSDMGDLSFCVDKEVQELNRAFYEGGGNG